ncbi:hypothetical protein [Hyalangium sp.]|uniref:hypothetical protein n=1 Tax=Hyalangium sp. TaxID=2028555 RepID=UPI002D3D5D90|nr:hypothetical protein [Hyalangium sp.]HYH98487.1 hypothetical protein [Hyalangium sp.]
MRNESELPGFGATLMGAAVLALAVTLAGGCGDDPEIIDDPPGNDGGQDIPDGGTDGGVQPPPDTAFAAVRFNTNGTLDTSFGSGGVTLVDVGPGTASARETLWSAARDSTDRIVLFGHSKGTDRLDVDRVVVRLSASGAVDTAFGTNGFSTLNLSNLGDNARNGIVQPDGKIVSSGYTSQPTGVGTQASNRVVLTRLNDDGKADTTFGSKGVVNSMPLQPADPLNTEWGMAEAYAVGHQTQSGKYVTTGYGRTAPSGQVDLVSFRYTSAGQLDTSWGTNGTFLLDVVGDNDRGRNLVVLPDDRVFMVGSGTPGAQNVDAMVLMLTVDGARDTTFSTDGYKLFSFGRPEEAFFGAAVSPAGDRVAAAGYLTGGGQDDDALLLLLPVGGGSGTDFVQPVPISESANDRFWAVAFDSAGKAYAAGYLTEGGDNRMIVARFNADGTRDTTFGTGGVATHNVVQAGLEEMARAVIIQSDGKVVIAGTVEKK